MGGAQIPSGKCLNQSGGTRSLPVTRNIHSHPQTLQKYCHPRKKNAKKLSHNVTLPRDVPPPTSGEGPRVSSRKRGPGSDRRWARSTCTPPSTYSDVKWMGANPRADFVRRRPIVGTLRLFPVKKLWGSGLRRPDNFGSLETDVAFNGCEKLASGGSKRTPLNASS